MGMIGLGLGVLTTAVGIITDDEKLVKKGMKRLAIGTTTLLIGDIGGVSDITSESFMGTDGA